MRFDPSLNVTTWSPQSAVEKRNAVEKKYYEDEFIRYICPRTENPPVLSLFDYTRVVGNRKLIATFFNYFSDGRIQFVNLGCGMDTASLWVHANFPKAVCYDLDLEFQMKVKVDIIKENKELLDLFPNCATACSSLHSDRYHIVPCDLRNVDELDRLFEFGFSSDLPTIFLSEFVLTYLENHLSNKVIEKVHQMTRRPAVLIYHEHVLLTLNPPKFRPSGKFMELGKDIMEEHEAPMYTLQEYPTLESQRSRYKELGWDDVLVWTYTDFYNQQVEPEEKKRLMAIEEVEDWGVVALYFRHSIIGVSIKGGTELRKALELNREGEGGDTSGFVPNISDEEVDAMDLEPSLKFASDIINVTYGTSSKECRLYYERFN